MRTIALCLLLTACGGPVEDGTTGGSSGTPLPCLPGYVQSGGYCLAPAPATTGGSTGGAPATSSGTSGGSTTGGESCVATCTSTETQCFDAAQATTGPCTTTCGIACAVGNYAPCGNLCVFSCDGFTASASYKSCCQDCVTTCAADAMNAEVVCQSTLTACLASC